MMVTYVLGTHVSHNGSACLLKDGQIAVAIEKERITRIKHDGGNDNAAVQYCLRAEGITLSDIEVVVQNANFDMFERRNCGSRASPRIVEDAQRVITISHHMAHAFSTIGTAPFADMTALVIDGCGNCYADCIDKEGAIIPEVPPTKDLEQLYFEKDSYYEYCNGAFRPIYKDFSPFGPRQRYPMYPATTMHSIGNAYLGVSAYVFRGMDDPGKLMGLAPYGRPNQFKEEMFTLRNGRVFLNYDWMREFDRPAKDHHDFKENFQYYADVAWWAQREIERALLYVVNSRYETTPAENLGYAGGVALNAVANRLIRTRTKFKNLYVQPAAGDNGLAIGCAYFGWLEILKGKRRMHNRRSHFGRRYTREEIHTCATKFADKIEFEERADVEDVCADLLIDGRVVGWFQGESEFGPRALGQRSILALPTNDAVRDFINSRIKFREDFRPFAPSVIAEDAALYFDQEYDSPYMILVAPVRPAWKAKIPAVVHRDGSARVQTVHRDISPLFYRLHEAVKRRVGLSVLLNTSLNRRGTPIVETPRHGIELFLETALDVLFVENWVIRRKTVARARNDTVTLESLFERIREAVESDENRPASLGILDLEVYGLRERWTLDFSGKPAVHKRASVDADHSIEITLDAMQRAISDPAVLRDLVDVGDVKIRGPLQTTTSAAVIEKLAYLLNVVRK
jgi:carbamoyltransferase